MAKIKLTKNEQKKQKDALKMYRRYLPTLILKKQQLQMEIRQVEKKQQEVRKRKEALNASFKDWIGVFAESSAWDDSLLEVQAIHRSWSNIAGVNIPTFAGVDYKTVEYDLFVKPFWIDKAVDNLKEVMALDLEVRILDEQVELLEHELKVTTQRVNLFEKVMIPETKANIKKIAVYLGDQQTASVVRGKIAKNKVVRVAE